MDWQPIETAPKDGAPVLVWEADELTRHLSASYFVAWWRDDAWCRAGDDYDLVVEPTHWYPLPTPPPSPDNPAK